MIDVWKRKFSFTNTNTYSSMLISVTMKYKNTEFWFGETFGMDKYVQCARLQYILDRY